jgi:hypothetical protein
MIAVSEDKMLLGALIHTFGGFDRLIDGLESEMRRPVLLGWLRRLLRLLLESPLRGRKSPSAAFRAHPFAWSRYP